MAQERFYVTVGQNAIPVHLGEGSDEIFRQGATVASSTELQALAGRRFAAFAPPMAWGPSITVASHIGAVSYSIDYTAVGDTIVMGRVTYWKANGRKVTEEFRDSTQITTSNSVGNVECEFRGIPLGSAVEVSCSP